MKNGILVLDCAARWSLDSVFVKNVLRRILIIAAFMFSSSSFAFSVHVVEWGFSNYGGSVDSIINTVETGYSCVDSPTVLSYLSSRDVICQKSAKSYMTAVACPSGQYWLGAGLGCSKSAPSSSSSSSSSSSACTAGQTKTGITVIGDSPTSMCSGGCVWQFTGANCGYSSTTGKYTCDVGTATTTGATCTASSSAASSSASSAAASSSSSISNNCDYGGTPIYNDGQLVGCSSSSSSAASSRASSAASSAASSGASSAASSAASSGASTSSGSSDSSASSGSGGSGSGSGSSSGSASSGSGSSSGSSTSSASSASSSGYSGGGDCATQPTCTGDAIQCAIAVDTWKNRCAMTPTDEQKAAYDAAVAAGSSGGSDNPVADANREKHDLSTAFSGITESFGSQCVPDLNFTVMNKSVNISTEKWCYWLGIIGNVGVMVSIFAAISLIAKG